MAVRAALNLFFLFQWAVLRLNLSRDASYRSTPAAVPKHIPQVHHSASVSLNFPTPSSRSHEAPFSAFAGFFALHYFSSYELHRPVGSGLARPAACHCLRAAAVPGFSCARRPGSRVDHRESSGAACCSPEFFPLGDLQAIFLTHIHLDHAGATGSLSRKILICRFMFTCAAQIIWPTPRICSPVPNAFMATI